MMLFVLILLLLAFLVQHFSTRDPLRFIRADYFPEENVVRPDQVFYLHISLKNTGRRYLPFIRLSFFLPVEIQPQDLSHCRADSYGRGCSVSYTTWLRPYQQTDLRIPVRICERGRYVFHPLHISCGDFLGLQEFRQENTAFREVVVAPREASAGDIDAAMSGFLGEVSVRRFLYEDPLMTAGFREYTGREPMKKISWIQSAKGHGMMVRLDDYTAQPVLTVILNADAQGPRASGEQEACFSLAAAVCRILEERHISYDLITNALPAGGWYGEECAVLDGTGSAHYEKALELLGRATHAVSSSGSMLAERSADSMVVRGRVLITAACGMPDAKSLEHLRMVSDGSLLILKAENPADGRKEAAG